MSRPLLEVSGLSMRCGGFLAVNGAALSVQAKQVVLPTQRPHLELKP